MTAKKRHGGLPSLFSKFLWIVKLTTPMNVAIYRLSGGRLMNKMEGCPVCIVTMTGHKSGQKRTIALMYVPDGDNVLLVASLGGAPNNPAWYQNFKARPEIEIEVGKSRRKMLAHEANPEEYAKVWPKAVAAYPSYAEYQKNTTRVIPVFICTPQR